MGTIQFKEVNCKNCYKCIRNCPVKAISVKDDHAQVIEDGCILCGKCLHICPQNAKSVENDVDRVKGFIDKKYKVYASIAPSFAPAFNVENISDINCVFEKLGFTYIEETAVGASKVSMEYKKLLEKQEMQNIITTACPTIVALVEKHYPTLINQMAPVVSPMIAHAKMMKEMYGSRIKVIFIGPCLSKKEEYKDFENNRVIDAVITFEEFEKWIDDEGISLLKQNNVELALSNHNINTRYYPAPGGIIKSIGTFKNKYKPIKFDGIERCIDILNTILEGNLKDYFIEMNSCVGGCLNGSCMNSGSHGFIEMREKLINYVNKCSTIVHSGMEYDTRVDLSKQFIDKSKPYIIPTETEIIKVLSTIGKFSKEDELNCGYCGYSSCREKAIAVINGKAEIYMCLPYMRERAESISNVIIHSTPNAIFAITEDFNIQEVNLAARKIFNLENDELHNKNIFEIIACPDIVLVNETKKDIMNNKCCYENYNIIVEQSILYIKENHMIVVIMKDITKDEKKQNQMHKMQNETVEIAQKVIDKQMRVAQEIASLLGETTAETKVALTKLKQSIQAEMGDII